MTSRILIAALVAVGLMLGSVPSAKKAEAQLITPYLVGMLAGPVSDGASVILVKKRPNFISWETPVIACTSGAGAGLIVSALPNLFTWVTTGFWNPIDWGQALLFSIYGCVVSGVGGIGGALTEWGLVAATGKGGH